MNNKISEFASKLHYNPSEVLEHPFLEAFLQCASIDYKSKEDHIYIKNNLGLESTMNADCSYSAKGLKGFSLSSYGWGTAFINWMSNEEKQIFLDMVHNKIIEPWRITLYKQYDMYNYNESGWIRYDKNIRKWVHTECPLKNIAEK